LPRASLPRCVCVCVCARACNIPAIYLPRVSPNWYAWCVCVCVCVYLCVCMYVCICVYTYVCVFVYIYTCIHAYIYVCKSYIHLHIYMYANPWSRYLPQDMQSLSSLLPGVVCCIHLHTYHTHTQTHIEPGVPSLHLRDVGRHDQAYLFVRRCQCGGFNGKHDPPCFPDCNAAGHHRIPAILCTGTNSQSILYSDFK
jgi:hypothetical protein